jgi:hypothetical protein
MGKKIPLTKTKEKSEKLCNQAVKPTFSFDIILKHFKIKAAFDFAIL